MLLARHIEVQNSVRADIFSDPDNMEVPMVRGTVREALRLYPVATFIGRILPIDAVIGNYEIPKHVRHNTILVSMEYVNCNYVYF